MPSISTADSDTVGLLYTFRCSETERLFLLSMGDNLKRNYNLVGNSQHFQKSKNSRYSCHTIKTYSMHIAGGGPLCWYILVQIVSSIVT